MSRYRDVALHVGLRAGAAGLAFVAQIGLVRLLGAERYGDYILFATACSLLFIFACSGLDTVVLRRVAIQADSGAGTPVAAIVRRAGLVSMATALLTVTAFSALRAMPAIERWSAQLPSLAWIAAGVLSMTVLAIALSAVRGSRRFLLADTAEGILKPLAMLGVAALLLTSGAMPPTQVAYAALLVANLLATGMALLAFRSWNAAPLPTAAAHDRPALLRPREAAGLVCYALMAYAMFQLDTLLVGLYSGTQEAGAYNMACNFVRLVIFVPLILAARAQPTVARQFARQEFAALRAALRSDLRRSVGTAAACAVVLMACGRSLLHAVDPSHAVAYGALCILALAHVVNSAVIVLNAALLMCAAQRTVVLAQLCGLAFSLPLYLLLIPRFGMAGAAVAVLAGLSANAAALAWQSPRVFARPTP